MLGHRGHTPVGITPVATGASHSSAAAATDGCRAKTKAGKACKAVAVNHGLCAFHADPNRAAQLGRLGGRKNRRYGLRSDASSVPAPQTAKDVKNLLAEVMADIHNGRLQPKIGSIMAYVGTALLKASFRHQIRFELCERA